ncbi:MAG: respiratory nitrate reductase subunit gamma [Micrococcales bacterium]|nr:respiratory nitrate reductase subunit gamma [Micrococcales bacterium]
MSWSVAAFGVWPYVALAVFVVGHVWRWRSDQMGWTTRSSQISEKRLLAWGSPLFHVGMLAVLLGHAAGLLVPASVTTALGISEHAYHLLAVTAGTISGTVLATGVVLLLLRRFVLKARLRLVTRRADVVMYVVSAVVIFCGMWATLQHNVLGAGYDYRETIAVWFRSIFAANPSVDLMVGVPFLYQVHVVAAFALIAVWPFSRLVHVWSVPVGYLTRPLIVYRAGRQTSELVRPSAVSGSGGSDYPVRRAR